MPACTQTLQSVTCQLWRLAVPFHLPAVALGSPIGVSFSSVPLRHENRAAAKDIISCCTLLISNPVVGADTRTQQLTELYVRSWFVVAHITLQTTPL
jgi:hypothetical protein